jgi:hypothetical protein
MQHLVPVLSKRNVKNIEKIFAENNIDAIVEFGSGNSTIYFLDKYQDQNIKFISVENHKGWFYSNIQTINSMFSCANIELTRSYWTSNDYKNFLSTHQEPYTQIQDGNSRVEKWKRIMDMGPFFRFEIDSGSRLQGKLGIFKPIFKPIFRLLNRLIRMHPKFANEKSFWKTEIENCQFFYELVEPAMKDQFGESPNRDAFIQAGVKHLTDSEKNILIMIDAGPRHYIVDEVLKLLEGKNLHICLFDAQRPEYTEILDKYKGTFHHGTTEKVDGSDLYEATIPDESIRNTHLKRELWVFSKTS